MFGVIPSPLQYPPRMKWHPRWCFFRVQHCSFAIQHMLSMKRHQRGCHFVSGIVPQYNTCQAQKTPSLVLFCVWHLSYALEHVSAPTLVCFCFWHLSYPLSHMLDMKKPHRWCAFVFSDFHTPPTHAEHKKTPSLVPFHVWHPLLHPLSIKWHLYWCYFVLRFFPVPLRGVD